MKQGFYLLLIVIVIVVGIWYASLDNDNGVLPPPPPPEKQHSRGGIPWRNGFQPEKHGYLNETQSKKWLSDNGYQIEKTDSGYQLQSDDTRSGEGINVSSRVNVTISQGATIIGHPLGENAVFSYIEDKFYIKPTASKN